MNRRARLRRTPGGRPGEHTGRCRLGTDERSRLCAGRPARPLPAALLLAMAAAAGKGVLAFAPIYSTDWPALARERLGSGGDAQGWWSRWAGVSCGDGSAGSAAALVAGRGAFRSGRSQRRSARGMGRRRVQQTWLAAERTQTNAAREDTPPSIENPRDGQARAGTNGNRSGTVPDSSIPARPKLGVISRSRTTIFNGVRRGTNGRGRGRKGTGGRGDRNAATVGGRGEGKTLAELVMYDAVKEEPALAAPTNKTELSQKVEAELFEEYDAMVPGPAAAVASFEGKSGDEIAQERTGRPLAINLDLLSWQAKQKNIKGEYAEARRLYRGCVELDPRDGRGWLGLARNMQKMHKFDKAARLFEAGLENCVDNPYLLQAFAVMEEERGNQGKALLLLNRSVRVHPEHTASWVALGLLNERNKRIDEARGCFKTATTNDPRNHYAWLVWGMLEKRVGNVTQAREKFKTCMRVNRRNAKIYQAWGVLEAAQDNYDLAAELFKEGLEQRSDNTYIMQAWAMMEAKRGDILQATTLLKNAIIKRPRDGAVWQSYALLMKDTGDITGARALFAKGAAQAPRHCPTWQAWGIMEWQQGQVAKARKLFQEGVWENPKGPFVVRILQAWAILEATEGNFDDARKYFGFALARDPYSLPVMVAWALTEESLGDIGRARQLLEIAAQTDSSNASIWSVYEQVETRGGFFKEARAVYDRGVMAIMSTQTPPSTSRREKGGLLLDLDPVKGSSLLDSASRSLSTSNSEMALRVSRIIGGVQWASDYMSFSAMNGSRTAEVAFEP